MKIKDMRLRVREFGWAVRIESGGGVVAVIRYGAGYPIRNRAQAKRLADKLVKAFNDAQEGK